jgi:PP-loop superfamily ATP-utilizing enzyme
MSLSNQVKTLDDVAFAEAINNNINAFICMIKIFDDAVTNNQNAQVTLSLNRYQWKEEKSKKIIHVLAKVMKELILVKYNHLIIDDDMCDGFNKLEKIDVSDSCIGCDEKQVKTMKKRLPNVEIHGVINGIAESDWKENGFRTIEMDNGGRRVTAISSNNFKDFAYSFTKMYKKIR